MYLFSSERLGFRNWKDPDIDKMAAINADPDVMHYFPSLPDLDQTVAFVDRMREMYAEKGFCYFAVDLLETGEFIGFIGLSVPAYDAHFTPCIDMGWRLDKNYWHKGYATEGARACQEYGFNALGLDEIIAICPVVNQPSEAVMKKTGMQKDGTFQHPLLTDNERLRECVLYRIRPETL